MSIEVRSKDIIVIDILKFIIQVEWTVKSITTNTEQDRIILR